MTTIVEQDNQINKAIKPGYTLLKNCGISVINVFLPAWFLSDLPTNYQKKDAVIRLEQELAAMAALVGL